MEFFPSASPQIFSDRRQAGRALAAELGQYRGRSDILILGLPRGGIPVAFEVAKALAVPMDVFIVRKLGVPGREELAMGAVAMGGVLVTNDHVLQGISDAAAVLRQVLLRERLELSRREKIYRENRDPLVVEGQTVILVDDGVATGATVRAAIQAIRKLRAARCLVAIPVGAPETCAELAREADEVICVLKPGTFHAVGEFYDDFSQTTDQEVSQLLAEARLREAES